MLLDILIPLPKEKHQKIVLNTRWFDSLSKTSDICARIIRDRKLNYTNRIPTQLQSFVQLH